MKMFIDCGTANFSGLIHFNTLYLFTPANYKIYCFEANPITYKSYPIPNKLKHLNIEHKNLAVSNETGEVTVNCCEVEHDNLSRYPLYARGIYRLRFALAKLLGKYPAFTAQGSNILTKPPASDGDSKFKYVKYEVGSVRLSDFILENKDEYEQIIIKMDIEGAEFAVLDDLIANNSYKYINKMYCEFHERFFDKPDLYTEKKETYKALFNEVGCEIVEWR